MQLGLFRCVDGGMKVDEIVGKQIRGFDINWGCYSWEEVIVVLGSDRILYLDYPKILGRVEIQFSFFVFISFP